MNDTLKVAGRIGAELGAAKAEIERLRGLLQQVVDCQAEHYGDGCGLHLSMITLAVRIKDALSQQADPTDTYTAVDMATAAAQGFRDGQAAVEQAAAQDERKTFEAWAKTQGDKWLIVGGLQWSAGTDDYASARTNAAWAAWQERAARPAQTEQQPVATWMGTDWNAQQQLIAHLCKLEPGTDLYAAPIAQTAPQQEQSGLNDDSKEAAMQKAFELGGLEDGSYHLESDELELVIRAALSARPAQTEQQPIRLPQRKNLDGLLDPESKRAGMAYNEALEDVELLNTPPIAQTAPQPEPSGLSLPRTRLERIERRLTDWLELNCCECESGHSCGRNEVTADRDAIRAALSTQGESHE